MGQAPNQASRWLRRRALPLRALACVPIFPLPDVVLFPGSVLPLHVFEPRYRKMVNDVMRGNKLLAIGMLLEKERPRRPPPRFANIVGVGEIVVAEPLPDGRFNLVVEGRARVAVKEELPADEPYRLVRAAELLDRPARDPASLAEAEASLRAIVEGLCRLLPEGGALLRQMAAGQSSATALADVLASTLVPDAQSRQKLLEMRVPEDRIERITLEVANLMARFSQSESAN